MQTEEGVPYCTDQLRDAFTSIQIYNGSHRTDGTTGGLSRKYQEESWREQVQEQEVLWWKRGITNTRNILEEGGFCLILGTHCRTNNWRQPLKLVLVKNRARSLDPTTRDGECWLLQKGLHGAWFDGPRSMSKSDGGMLKVIGELIRGTMRSSFLIREADSRSGDAAWHLCWPQLSVWVTTIRAATHPGQELSAACLTGTLYLPLPKIHPCSQVQDTAPDQG